MKRFSIITKLLIYILVVGILLGGVSNFINSKELIDKYHKELHEKNNYIVDSFAGDMESKLFSMEEEVELLELLCIGNMTPLEEKIEDMNSQEEFFIKVFRGLLNSSYRESNNIYVYFDPSLDGDVHDVWLVKTNNDIIRQSEIPLERYEKNINMSWFYQPRNLGYPVWTDPYRNRFDRHVSSYVTPVFVDGRFVGIIGMYLELKGIKDSLFNVDNYRDDYLWLRNSEEVIYHPDYPDGTNTGDFLVSGEDENSEIQTVLINDIEYYHYENILHNGWILNYNVPKIEIDGMVNEIIRRMFLQYFFSLTVFVILMIFITKKYRGNFKKIFEGFEEINSGNTDFVIDIESNDEIGRMVEIINKSNENISGLLNQLKKVAYSNEISGIYNRNKMIEDISRIMDNQNKSGRISILYMDIENFRTINELLGYEEGNSFVNYVIKIIRSAGVKDGIFYHVAVDEFAYVFIGDYSQEQLLRYSDLIKNNFAQNISFGNHIFYLTLYISIIICDGNEGDIKDVIRKIDVASEYAKEKGSNYVAVYEENLFNMKMDQNNAKNDFQDALLAESFYMVYQPKVSMANYLVEGMEALIRVNHPTKGDIPTGRFIEYAEKSGLIIELGEKILNLVFQQIESWEKRDIPKKRVSINISIRQLIEDDFVDMVRRVLAKYHFDYSWIEFEITESVFMDNDKRIIEKLKEIKAMGIMLSLDDFGVGYSSINLLSKLPMDILKIDRSLIETIHSSEKTKKLVKSIIEMGHGLELKVVAEGVEVEEQMLILNQMDCDYIQGYYYSKPLISNDIEMYWQNEKLK